MLRSGLAWRGSIQAPLGAGWEKQLAVLRETRRLTPLLMCDAAALQIQIGVRAVRGLDGVMAEAGVFRGGSARLICEAKGEVPLHLFDVFETLQGAAAMGPGGDSREIAAHFTTTHGRRQDVARMLAAYPNVHLHCGLFRDLCGSVEEQRFSFVHLDLDLPGGTENALEFFHPRMMGGAVLIGDDYADAGVRAVFDRFFAGRKDTVIPLPWSQVMIVRQA